MTEEWHGEIPDEEWSILLAFLAESERLTGTKMLREGFKVNVTFVMDRTSFRVTSTLPPRDDLDAFLHRMRPFVLQKERLFYNTIHGLLWRRITFDPFHALLEQQHRLFSGKDFRDQLEMAIVQGVVDAVQKKVVNDEATLDQWLNVHEYHRDEGAKRAQLERISTIVPVKDLEGIFVSMMVDKSKAICALAATIRRMRERDGVPHTFPIAPETKSPQGSAVEDSAVEQTPTEPNK